MRLPLYLRIACDRAERLCIDLINRYDACYDSKILNHVRNWFDRHGESTAICHECCVLNIPSPDDKVWKPLFLRIAMHIGLQKRSASLLFEDFGVMNNWEHLHPTDREMHMTAEQCASHFLCDTHYCSDRWSLDRLLRVQWMYRHWEYILSKEDTHHESSV